ncbi:MAG: response regulator [Deltaproteobacteria bacterium]|nr:response regulator [Deltaproteobacteria bacterium]
MPEPLGKNLRFLVVDDQFNVRRMIHNFLRNFGYNDVIYAADGLAAWEKLAQEQVGFVISDWNMPRMNGLLLLRKVRDHAQYRDIPFLMVTAETNEDIVAEAVESGVDDYVTKPFRAKTVIDKVEMVLARRLDPKPLDRVLYRAKDLLAEGRPTEAMATLKLAVEAAPTSPRVLVAVGDALEALSKNDAALAKFEEAAALGAKYVTAHDRAASLYEKLGQKDRASDHLALASRISPRNPHRQVTLGQMLMEQGRTEEGAMALRAARDVATEDAELTAKVGELFLEAGLNKEAAACLRRAVAMDPRMVHIYNQLGMAYRRERRYEQAAAEYRRAINASPEDENLHFNLAVTLAEWNKPAEAIKTLEQALNLRDDFPEAQALMQHLRDIMKQLS